MSQLVADRAYPDTGLFICCKPVGELDTVQGNFFADFLVSNAKEMMAMLEDSLYLPA